MSLKLYHASNLMTAGIKVEVVAQMLGSDLENIRLPGNEWKQEAHLKRNPFGKIPAMETPEGPIFESCALLRYLARKAGKMYGETPFQTAQIDQWLEFFNTQYQPVASLINRTTYGYVIFPKDKFDDAMKELQELIKIMDSYLADHKFLGSKELNIADVTLATNLRMVMRLYLPEKQRNANPNFMRWFNEVNSHPVMTKAYGKLWLCQKEFVPDFTYGKKEAPKKQEKNKDQQKGAKKKEEKKDEKPKNEKQPAKKETTKKQKKEQVGQQPVAKKEQVEQQQLVQKKKTNPLDKLPKSTFILDDWKREFVNTQDPKACLKEFWTKYDPEGWSLWKTHYIRYQGEGKVGYLTANLKNGYLRNIDHFRKYCFAVLGVYGVEGDYEIDGVWLWRGTEIPQEWKEHQSYDFFQFTRLDHTKEEHRKLVEDYWLCLNEGDMVDGHPVFEAKWFK